MFGKTVYQIGARMNRIEREQRNRKPRSIKGSTAARYTTKQIYKHLARVQDKLFTNGDTTSNHYRIDFQFEDVYVWSKRAGRYVLYGRMHAYDYKPALGAVLEIYERHDIDHDWLDQDGFLEKKGFAI